MKMFWLTDPILRIELSFDIYGQSLIFLGRLENLAVRSIKEVNLPARVCVQIVFTNVLGGQFSDHWLVAGSTDTKINDGMCTLGTQHLEQACDIPASVYVRSSALAALSRRVLDVTAFKAAAISGTSRLMVAESAPPTDNARCLPGASERSQRACSTLPETR